MGDRFCPDTLRDIEGNRFFHIIAFRRIIHSDAPELRLPVLFDRSTLCNRCFFRLLFLSFFLFRVLLFFILAGCGTGGEVVPDGFKGLLVYLEVDKQKRCDDEQDDDHKQCSCVVKQPCCQ